MKRTSVILLLLPFAAFAGSIDPALHAERRGEVQFSAVERDNTTPLVQNTAGVVLRITPDNAVTGTSADTGCQFNGNIAPADGTDDLLVRIESNVTGCYAAPMNRRYAGAARLEKLNGTLFFTLKAAEMATGGAPRLFEIKGAITK